MGVLARRLCVMADGRAAAWDGGPVQVATPGEPAWSADDAVAALFAAHYRGLVRLAVLLLHSDAAAEDVVQDAYVALHRRWWRLRDADRALAYLRTSVVNGARSALRKRGVADRHAARVLQTAAEMVVVSAETGALSL